MSKIRITDTSLRDGHQSLWATRMTTEDMLPVLKKLDEVGYHSLEIWGGATYDVCIRYLNEDPWERLRTIRKHVSQTKLQMLLRGQSIVGYSHYPDDVVEKFVEKAAENGIDIFRVFDALNDIRNLETCMGAVRRTGKHLQASLVYTTSPVHSLEHYIETALALKAMGADSICIKDMAGLLSPYVAFKLVKALKEQVDLPIQLHTHYIGGLAVATCLKAAEAGVDLIDTASVPMAFGSSQPPVETIVRALQGSDWDTGLNLHELFKIATHFEKIRIHKGFERGVTKISDMKVFEHQVPGGMISNFVAQLEEQKASHRLDEVLEEIPRVRRDLGYPPLVTPTSQIVGTQAVLNVLLGERYKLCPGEVKDYVRGLYGRPPAPIENHIVQKIVGDGDLITVRPADLIEPGWAKAKQEMSGISDLEEDILTYALFPAVARKFFENRHNRASEDTPQILPAEELQPNYRRQPDIAPVRERHLNQSKVHSRGDNTMNLKEISDLIQLLEQSSLSEVEVQENDFRISLRKAPNINRSNDNIFIPPVSQESKIEPPVLAIDTDIASINSPMVGTFYAAPSPDANPYVKTGDHVTKGQTLCIIEAMKLMNEIKAEFDGTILEIPVQNGAAVEYNEVLFLIKKD